ncbi:hypothetical protein KFE25_006267 [Diacronema lutheri]|uniref:Uncharacterized protein n=1 Tax=Diacronema lutheri TaxID=2081491 RepID=A0A8J5XWA2_DIALT|nr:hypothetical protein KFE25_006267 [Diacronema lutheri]
MNTFDIATSRPSTTVHAAPGGKSTFSLAHDSGADGMTPRELAAARKLERQAESDRQYRAMTQMLDNDGARRTAEDSTEKLFGKGAPAPKPDLFELSAPFAGHSEGASERMSTRVNAAPGGRQTIVLGSDSPTWGKEDSFNKAKPLFKARESGHQHPEMAMGGNMANLLAYKDAVPAPVLGLANQSPVPEPTSVPPAKQDALLASGGPPDTSEMTHKQRIAAMKAYRTSQENVGAFGGAPPAVQKQFTAGKNDGLTHTSESNIGERPSSRVLAPPGGKSTFTLG